MLEHKEIKYGDPEQTPKKNQIQEIKDFLDLHFEFRKNILTLDIEYRAFESSTFSVLDDMALNSIWVDLQMSGYKCSDALVGKLLNSKLTKTYNPLIDYFDALPKY